MPRPLADNSGNLSSVQGVWAWGLRYAWRFRWCLEIPMNWKRGLRRCVDAQRAQLSALCYGFQPARELSAAGAGLVADPKPSWSQRCWDALEKASYHPDSRAALSPENPSHADVYTLNNSLLMYFHCSIKVKDCSNFPFIDALGRCSILTLQFWNGNFPCQFYMQRAKWWMSEVWSSLWFAKYNLHKI